MYNHFPLVASIFFHSSGPSQMMLRFKINQKSRRILNNNPKRGWGDHIKKHNSNAFRPVKIEYFTVSLEILFSCYCLYIKSEMSP
jgi:hypothetical protein